MSATCSILCPICDYLYDDITHYPYCCFNCLYTVCEQCNFEKNAEKCDICEKPANFVKNYAAMELFLDLKASVTENILDQQFGKSIICNSCKETVKKVARICATCSESLIVKNAFGKWHSISPDFSRLEVRALCAGCSSDHSEEHENHELIKLSEIRGINALTDPIRRLYALSALFEEKMHNEPATCDFWEQFCEFREMSHQMELWRKIDFLKILRDDMEINEFQTMEQQEFYDPETIELLRKSKKKSMEKVEKSYWKNEMLRERIRIYMVNNIREYVELMKEKKSNDLEHFEKIQMSLMGNLKVQLSEEEIQKIDTEIDAKMEALESIILSKTNLHIHPETTNFLKYRAILSEARKIHVAKEEIIRSLVEESDKRARFDKEKDKEIEEMIGRIGELEENDNGYSEESVELIMWQEKIKFKNFEIMEESLRTDKKIMRRLSVSCKQLFLILMKIRYFSIIPGTSYEDGAFHKLLERDSIQLRFFP